MNPNKRSRNKMAQAQYSKTTKTQRKTKKIFQEARNQIAFKEAIFRMKSEFNSNNKSLNIIM